MDASSPVPVALGPEQRRALACLSVIGMWTRMHPLPTLPVPDLDEVRELRRPEVES